MADAAVLGPAIPGGTAAAGGATAAADESPLTTRSDSYSTKVITEAPRQFSDWFEQQMLKPEFKHAARKIALDPKFIATILTKTIQARIDGFELVEKQKKHGDIIDVKVNGEPMRHIRDDGSPGDAISIKTAFEWDDDPSQKDYDRKTAKDMKIQRQELGDMLYAEYLRRSGNLLDRNEQRLVAENPWTDDINDLQMGIIHTTMSAMDASTGWVGTTPQDVWFSSLEQWAETMHPDKKGQYMGSVLHDMSKSMLKLGGADQPKVDHGVRLIRKEDAKAYIKGKVDEQIRYARNTAEKIAYAVITTPANEEVVVTIRDVKGNDKQVELGVPGLGMEVPGTETLRRKKTSLDAKDQEYQRRSPSLEDHRERKRKIEAKEIRDDGIDHAGKIEAIEELGREVSGLKAEYHKLASTDARAKERAADVARDLLLALLNTKEPLGTYLEQNPTRFCGEVNQNSVLSSILGEIDGLVIQRQSLDKFSPGKRRLVEETEEIKDGSTKITRKYEGEDDAPLPLFEARKRRLEANVTALTARIDAEELPDDLKEELVSLAESVKDTNLKTEKVKEHVETQKKMLAKAINPMRAVVEEVGREMDFQMLIMNATYDGGLDRAKGEAPPINKMNIIEVQLRRFWKLFDHAHWPKIKQKVKDFISTPFRWLDDGMYGTLPPLELQRPGEDADFK
ncbi:TPA: hypothetical protein EYP38_01590, partial [Candidatus Micrarchaeota archaeon]|nr:hypothetical protein [Candidatus Micrarchaeota archaeon]